MKTTFFAAAAAVMTMSTPAYAAVVSYTVQGTFDDGSVLDGGFSLDSAKYGLQQFSNIDVSVSGYGKFFKVTQTAFNPWTKTYLMRFYNNSRNLDLWLNSGSTSAATLVVKLGDLDGKTSFGSVSGATFGLANGTIAAADTGAVPEPATWMMLLFGFGVIGYALRRKTVLRYV